MKHEPTTPLLDTGTLRRDLRGGGEWARQCGERVARRREHLGLTSTQLAQLVGVPEPTIWKVEQGLLAPRDYLKIAIAFAMATPVEHLFPYPERERVSEMYRTEEAVA